MSSRRGWAISTLGYTLCQPSNIPQQCGIQAMTDDVQRRAVWTGQEERSGGTRRALLRFGLATASLWTGSAAAADPPPAMAPAPSVSYQPPNDIAFKVIEFVSEGVRLQGELFRPASAGAAKLPTVLMAHGWGGVAAGFRPDAVDLARAGFMVMIFDYRGWGASDLRVVLTGPEPAGRDDSRFATEVMALRGYVDPFEQVDDWFNAIDWIAGEPTADITRLGLRGSSFSGGHVIYVAARDPRVKAIVSQVGGIADRPAPAAMQTMEQRPYIEAARRQGTLMAWGETGYPPAFAKTFANLTGQAVGDRSVRWWPNAESPYVQAAALFVLAGADGLVDNPRNGELAYQRVPGVKKLVVIPNATHFQIYGEYRTQAVALAIDWFKAHLS